MSVSGAERVAEVADADGRPAQVATTVAEMLELDYVEPNVYRASPGNLSTAHGIYGGRVAAQALRAAVHTVPEDRIVHSLHSYFVRPGEATLPITLHVDQNRDGGTFSTRRVVAEQDGEILFSMLASFHQDESGPEFQAATIPVADDPDTLPEVRLGRWTLDLDARVPPMPGSFHRWPTRMWIRAKQPLPADRNIHACALVFMSDMCTGLAKAPRVEEAGMLPSLDHSLWLHHAVHANDWMLMDLVPEVTSNGRGMYTGRMFQHDGKLLASLAQESLFRVRPAGDRLPG